MKKSLVYFLMLAGFVLSSTSVYAEDAPAAASAAVDAAVDAVKDAATQEASQAVEKAVTEVTDAQTVENLEQVAEQVSTPEVPQAVTEAPVAAEQAENITENLEFVSGEVSSVDANAKSLTIKLYGETENAQEKSLTVKVDENTDITDGEKDRDLGSLTTGTEVDVEYDPSANKATYIFIY